MTVGPPPPGREGQRWGSSCSAWLRLIGEGTVEPGIWSSRPVGNELTFKLSPGWSLDRKKEKQIVGHFLFLP